MSASNTFREPRRTIVRRLLIATAAVACSDSVGGTEPPPAVSLAFQTQPALVAKGATFVEPVRVAVLDAQGDVLTSSSASITIGIGTNPGGATLVGTATVAAASGVATFGSIAIDAVGTGYTLVASAAALPNTTSATFNVVLSLNDLDGDSFSPDDGDCNDNVAAINPLATDRPDANFIDSNCDGIDGETDNAVFVSTAGADGPECGTRSAPCLTIPIGIQRATVQARRDVYVSNGTFAGAVTLADGVSVYGAFSMSWERSADYVTTITGSNSVAVGGPEPQALTIYGTTLATQSTLADVTIIGPNATGTTIAGKGRSSYAVVLRDVPYGALTVERVKIFSGNGSAGAPGIPGVDAPDVTPEMHGGKGADGAQLEVTCDNTSFGQGGTAGTNLALGQLDPNGGAGGAGGRIHFRCDPPEDFSPTPGQRGIFAATLFDGTTFGFGGPAGFPFSPCSFSTPPGPGSGGFVQNGASAVPLPGGSVGSLIDDFWYAASGNPGGLGLNGSGGGGGGGSAGCAEEPESYGGGGGGGGAGGLSARGIAGGGQGGGGSFGVYLINASPSLLQVIVNRGRGGDGGAGGVGGRGQSGGLGGEGGLGRRGLPGARGGNGAHGGHGGGGGGGGGGISAGVYLTSFASTPLLSLLSLGGGGGLGGVGGASAPDAPATERDGNPGPSGPIGALLNLGICRSPANCS